MKKIKKSELKNLISECAEQTLNEISSALLNRAATRQEQAMDDDFYLENHSDEYIKKAYNRIDKFKQGAKDARLKEILGKKQSAPQRNRDFEKEQYLIPILNEYVEKKFKDEIQKIIDLYFQFMESSEFQDIIKQHIEYYSLDESVNNNVQNADINDMTRHSDAEMLNMKAYTTLEQLILDGVHACSYSNIKYTSSYQWKPKDKKDTNFTFMLLNIILKKKFEEKGYLLVKPKSGIDFSNHTPYIFRPKKSKKFVQSKIQLDFKDQISWSAIRNIPKMDVKFYYASHNNRYNTWSDPDLFVEFDLPEEYGTFKKNFFNTYVRLFNEMVFKFDNLLINFEDVFNVINDAAYKVCQKKSSIFIKDNHVEQGEYGRFYKAKYYVLFNKPCYKASGLSMESWRNKILDFLKRESWSSSCETLYVKSLGLGYGSQYPGLTNKEYGDCVGIIFKNSYDDENSAEQKFKQFLSAININDMNAILQSGNPSIGKIEPKDAPRNNFIEITKETFAN